MRDQKIRYECKVEELNKQLNQQTEKYNNLHKKHERHKDISKQCINSLKNKIHELEKTPEELLEQYLENKFGVSYDLNNKSCAACGVEKILDICDNCQKYFCELHITDINDGFHTGACDNCFNTVYDEYNKYKLENEIVMN